MGSDKLSSILSDLNSSTNDIEGSAIISTDGLIMASLLPAGMGEDEVSAMSAAVLSLSSRTSEKLMRGSLEQILIKGKNGYILMTYAGPDRLITVVTKPEARLGLIFLDVKRATDAVQKLNAK